MKPHRRLVVMFAGGGVTHTSGGVGTFIRYLIDDWAAKPDAPRIKVIDTKGEGKAVMALHLLKAIVFLLSWGIIGRIDLLHVHMSAYGSVVRKGVLILIGRLLGIPVIVHMHGSNFHKFYTGLPSSCQKLLKFILNLAQYVIVLGDNWRDSLINVVHIAPQKIVVIFNGVPLPTRPKMPGTSRGDGIRMVFLGHIGERKGVPELIEALHSPRLLSKNLTATIAGDGDVEGCRATIRKIGLEARVSVPGWVDRDAASDLLREADIFVLPSHFEAMPIAILEALAHGVAVIATPVGAIPEFLTDGVTALLVPPGAPDKLVEAIVRLSDDVEERERLAAAGHHLFLERFDISVAADRILALYASAMQSEASQAPADKRPGINTNHGQMRL
ncbi:MAG TPA: glycosyltransferase family 4 protein [Acetobacteraceae bacterium]|jgi:glycosyltransferase involved in cell wall biosynthesis|nr:glycosyltransferase family 4 protein [Acetobacteraceae bacterium]